MDKHTQPVIRTFRLDRAALDAQIGSPAPTQKESRPNLENSRRFMSVINDLQDEVVGLGYRMFIAHLNVQYRGLPERVLVIDNEAPFYTSKDYIQDFTRKILDVMGRLQLPYEGEDLFIDMSLRRL